LLNFGSKFLSCFFAKGTLQNLKQSDTKLQKLETKLLNWDQNFFQKLILKKVLFLPNLAPPPDEIPYPPFVNNINVRPQTLS